MPEAPSRKPVVTEDWAVVLVGFVVILVSLYLYIIPTPSYSWSTAADLQGKVFAGSNLLKVVSQFGAVLIAGILAVWITGKNIR
jgi:hypothetical protein